MNKAIILNTVLITLTLVFLVFSVKIDYFFPVPQTGLHEGDIPKMLEPIDTSGGTNPGAPIDLIEFSDYSCGFCRDTHPDLMKILVEYDDQINFVYKHMPAGEDSYKASLAAECARDQNKFLHYHNALFLSDDLSESNLISIAENLNLDMDSFKSCIANKEKMIILEKDMSDAQANDIQGTPIFIINGDIIIGSQTYESLKVIIDRQLDPESIATSILEGNI